MPTIISETEHLIAVNKPAGLIAHRDGRTEESSVAEWLQEKFPYLQNVGEPWVSPQGESVPIAGLVHRLDRTTSGVLLAAKTQEVFDLCKVEFKTRKVEKIYRAWVHGLVEGSSGKIVAEIVRTSDIPKRWAARSCEETDPRAAITIWRLVKHFSDQTTKKPASYIDAQPRTGRTHQIRVHMASIGHPLVSDHLYAPDMPQLLGFKRPALHAYSIAISLFGELYTFTAPLPADFLAVES